MSILDSFSLKGKTAFVTGASYGIGFAIAQALSEAGASVAFCERKEEKVQKGLEAYKVAGLNVKGFRCDVTKEQEVAETIRRIQDELGTIDILVNNAGIIRRIPMTEMSAESFREVVDIDLLGRETVSAYAAAKGGLKMLTRNICSEYGKYNIQCNGIGPGYIATPQTAPLREKQPDGSRHPFDSFIVAKTPAERWGTPADLGGAAVFLASDASDFVNGQVLYVDGGILAYIGRQP